MADTNPIVSGAGSAEGKLAIGVGVFSGVVVAIAPFLPDLQAQLAAKNYTGAIMVAVGLLSAAIASLGFSISRGNVKAAAITTNTLPMSNTSKV